MLALPFATPAASASLAACVSLVDRPEASAAATRIGCPIGELVDVDPPHARRRDACLQQAPDALHVALAEHLGLDRARNGRRVLDDGVLALAVVLLGNLLRRAEHGVDRLADPLPRAAADQLAPDDEHQQRRNDGEPEQRADQLRAEARERQAAAPFDQQLDDVARQHEAEREQHRQIGDRQRVEQDLGQEVRVEIGRPVGERDHGHQRREQDDDAEQDQARVVAERPAGSRRRTAARRRGQRRLLDITQRGRHGFSPEVPGASALPNLWHSWQSWRFWQRPGRRRRRGHRRKVNFASPATSVPCQGQTNDALRGVVRARTRT